MCVAAAAAALAAKQANVTAAAALEDAVANTPETPDGVTVGEVALPLQRRSVAPSHAPPRPSTPGSSSPQVVSTAASRPVPHAPDCPVAGDRLDATNEDAAQPDELNTSHGAFHSPGFGSSGTSLTPHAASVWARPPRSHSNIPSCYCLGVLPITLH